MAPGPGLEVCHPALQQFGDGEAPGMTVPASLLHVNPFKPPTRGRDVVVYKKDGAVLILSLIHI